MITLSPIIEADREVLAAGLDELSEESRYSRFGQAIGRLSEAELDYLSSVDQRSHVAWGALHDGEVAGVGRYIVTPDIERAELAVTVVDAHQHVGVGTALFRTLAAVARHDGIHELVFEAQADNQAVIHTMKGMGLPIFLDEGLIKGIVRLAELPVESDDAEAVRIIEAIRG